MTEDDRQIIRVALDRYFDLDEHFSDVYAPEVPPERVEGGAWVKLEVFVTSNEINQRKEAR